MVSPSLGNQKASREALLSRFPGSGCPVLERLCGVGSGPRGPQL